MESLSVDDGKSKRLAIFNLGAVGQYIATPKSLQILIKVRYNSVKTLTVAPLFYLPISYNNPKIFLDELSLLVTSGATERNGGLLGILIFQRSIFARRELFLLVFSSSMLLHNNDQRENIQSIESAF